MATNQQPKFAYENKSTESPFETFLKYTNQKAVSSKQLSKILQPLDSRSNILDLGTGNGEYLHLALSHIENTKNIHLTLVEPSADLATHLEGRFDSIVPRPHLTIIPTDFDTFSSNEKFDIVIAAHLLYHIPSSTWPQQLERMISLLKPRGRLIIILRGKDDAYLFKMNFMPLLTHSNFSALTIEDVFSALSHINAPRVTQYTSESILNIPMSSNEDDARSIVEFYLNKQWPDIPTSIQQQAFNFIRDRHGVFKQLDCFAVIEKQDHN